MSIKFTGRYVPGGVLKIKRGLIAPVFSILPSITYTKLETGSTFTANPGTFTPANSDVTYSWKINGTEVGVGSVFVPVTSGNLNLTVTVSNGAGSVSHNTPSLAIIFPAPTYTVDPSISPNSAPMGTLMTGNDGTFTNGIVTARAWLLNNVPLSGATQSTYIPDGIGNLTYRVTVTGNGGTITRTSSPVTITSVPDKLNAPTWNMATGNLGTFAEGSSISIPLLTSDPENNVQSYEVVNGALPNGVTLGLMNGVISGSLAEVTEDTIYVFTIRVTDRTNLTLIGNFSISVANVKTTVTWQTSNTADLANPAPGQPVTVKLEATSI